MERNILCTGPQASVPFHIESIQTDIYSIQELCFLIGNEPELMDETVLGRPLAQWLVKECGLDRIRELSSALFSSGSEEKTSVFLLEAGDYHYGPELKKAVDNVHRYFGMSDHDRAKKRGDTLFRHMQYDNALAAYRSALELTAGNKYLSSFRSDVYYNCGCAEAAQFKTGRAADDFRRAVKLEDTKEKRLGYLSAVYLDKGKESFIEEAQKLGFTEEDMQEILIDYKMLELPTPPDDPDECLMTWIKEYKRSG